MHGECPLGAGTGRVRQVNRTRRQIGKEPIMSDQPVMMPLPPTMTPYKAAFVARAYFVLTRRSRNMCEPQDMYRLARQGAFGPIIETQRPGSRAPHMEIETAKLLQWCEAQPTKDQEELHEIGQQLDNLQARIDAIRSRFEG